MTEHDLGTKTEPESKGSLNASNLIKQNPAKSLSLDQDLEQWKAKLNEQWNAIEHQNEQQQPSEPFPFAGYVATMVASLLFACSGLCIKLLPVEATIQEKAKACMIRGTFMMLYSAIGVAHRGHSFKLPRDELLINFMRSLFGAIGMMANYIALNYISIGESSAIIYSSPIWTCLLSFLILKEPLRVSMLLALPASLVGILLLAKPDVLESIGMEFAGGDYASKNSTGGYFRGDQRTKLIEQAELEHYESRLPGVLAALTCSVLLAMIIIVLKYRKKTPIETCSFYLGIGVVSVSVGVQLVTGFGAMPSSLLECSLHLLIGLISYLNQFLFQWALQFVPAGIYSVTRSLDIVFGFLMSALFLQELVPTTSLAGSILTILVIVILVLDAHIIRAIKRIFSS